MYKYVVSDWLHILDEDMHNDLDVVILWSLTL